MDEKYNGSPVEELDFFAPRKTITGKFVLDKKENETMRLRTMEQRTEGMKRQAQELIEHAYDRGFKTGQEEAKINYDKKWEEQAKAADYYIEQGRNEAWEAAKKISSTDAYKLNDIFEEGWFWDIFNKFSASEVISKIKAYEEQKQKEAEEIHVGDEVAFPCGDNLVVVRVSENNDIFEGIYTNGNGVGMCLSKSQAIKTGRHFPQIAEVLKKMKEGE